MNKLSYKEFEDAPEIVKYLHIAAFYKIPVGSSLYEDAMGKHPGYFSEEIERRKKWEAIPKDVRDSYFKELCEAEEEIFDRVPHAGKGIVFYSQHSKEAEEHSRGWEKANKELEPIRRKIHDKYFTKYGIKYD